jgi:PTS system fructose-specific IIC component
MKLAELIGEECVLFDFQSDGKWKAIESILDHLVKVGRVTPEQRMPFLDALVRRETLASTGMDNGVALPHAQVEGLDSAVAAVAISKVGVPFESSDDSLSRILVLLVIPKRDVRSHVRTLAGIARLLNSEEMRSSLMDAGSARQVADIIREAESKS